MKHDCNRWTCPECALRRVIESAEYVIELRDRIDHHATRQCLAVEHGMIPIDPCPCLPCYARRLQRSFAAGNA